MPDLSEPERQRQVAAALARFTGAEPYASGRDVRLWPEVGGVRLPLLVSPTGDVALGAASVTGPQLARLLAGLRSIAAPSGGRKARR